MVTPTEHARMSADGPEQRQADLDERRAAADEHLDLDEQLADEAGENLCRHDWRFVRDWYGDPAVIQGTADCSYFECRDCCAIAEEVPDLDDYDDYVEPPYEQDDAGVTGEWSNS